MKKSVILILAVLGFFSKTAIAQDSSITSLPIIAVSNGFGVQNDWVYNIVDEMPHYLNGEKALRDTFSKYIQYPQYEKENKIKGTVILGFVVTEIGAIEKIEVKKSVSEGLDEEALRLMRLIPSFIPGKQQGKAVKVAYVLPVMFKLPAE